MCCSSEAEAAGAITTTTTTAHRTVDVGRQYGDSRHEHDQSDHQLFATVDDRQEAAPNVHPDRTDRSLSGDERRQSELTDGGV